MIVRHDRHTGTPDHVENGQLRRIIKLLHLGARRGAQPRYDCGGLGNGTCDNFTDRFVSRVEAGCRPALGDEAIEVEHVPSSLSAKRLLARRLRSDAPFDGNNWPYRILAPNRDRRTAGNGAALPP